MASFFRGVDKVNIHGGSFAIKHGPDHSQETVYHGPVSNKYDYSTHKTSFGSFQNQGNFIGTNNGEVNHYNYQHGYGRGEPWSGPRRDYDDYPRQYGRGSDYPRGPYRPPPPRGAPYRSQTAPMVDPYPDYDDHSDIYADEEPPPSNPGPAFNPRATPRSRPDPYANIEDELQNLPPHMQKYLKSLQKKAQKADVVDDADEFLPDNMAKMNLDDSDRSSPGPAFSENRGDPFPQRKWEKAPRKLLSDYPSYSTRSRSGTPDSDTVPSDDERFPTVRNFNSNGVSTEYIANCDNNNSTRIEVIKEVKGRSKRKKKANK